MPRSTRIKTALTGTLLAVVFAVLSIPVSADTAKVEGVIKGRSGANMIVQTTDYPRLVVVLQDSTKVSQIKGVLKARRHEMSMAALIPGLIVQVEGNSTSTSNCSQAPSSLRVMI